MIDNVLQELIDFLKTASPLIWEALYKQVYVIAWAKLAWVTGLAISAVTSVILAKWAHRKNEEDSLDSWDGLEAFAYILTGVIVIISFSLLVGAAMRFANPNYYAIRLILQQIGG